MLLRAIIAMSEGEPMIYIVGRTKDNIRSHLIPEFVRLAEAAHLSLKPATIHGSIGKLGFVFGDSTVVFQTIGEAIDAGKHFTDHYATE